MKFIHMTDTHLVSPGERLYGLDPAARLEAAIADINARHADAARVVITGDLTHRGEESAYRCFAEILSRLKVACTVLIGNHDHREVCLAHLVAAPSDDRGFVQGALDTDAGRMVFLDTHDAASDAGQLCWQRLAWLEVTLAAAYAEQSFPLFMHHPPFDVGLHDMNGIAPAERAAFREVIEPYRQRIRHLFFGHVHRPISGSWEGIAFSTLRGTCHQAWLDLAPGGVHLASHEPPSYGVVLASPRGLTVHNHDFLYPGPHFPFSPRSAVGAPSQVAAIPGSAPHGGRAVLHP